MNQLALITWWKRFVFMGFSKDFGWEQKGFRDAILGVAKAMIRYLRNANINIKKIK